MIHFSECIPVIKRHMTLAGFNSRVEQGEERISKLENRAVEIAQSVTVIDSYCHENSSLVFVIVIFFYKLFC